MTLKHAPNRNTATTVQHKKRNTFFVRADGETMLLRQEAALSVGNQQQLSNHSGLLAVRRGGFCRDRLKEA